MRSLSTGTVADQRPDASSRGRHTRRNGRRDGARARCDAAGLRARSDRGTQREARAITPRELGRAMRLMSEGFNDRVS
jgi:hypothetical protein